MTDSEEDLHRLRHDLECFSTAPIFIYPSLEIPPYAPLAPDPATTSLRLATLYRLAEKPAGEWLLLVPVEALVRRILPGRLLLEAAELVVAGEELDRDAIVAALEAGGYQPVDLVQREGEMAVRGGIVDLWAPPLEPALAHPIRLDFFGDQLESIRVFDPATQRAFDRLDEAVVLPASEILFPGDGEAVVQRLRQWRDRLGWADEAADMLEEQLSSRIRFPGIEYATPIVYGEALQSLFDYFPDDLTVVLLEPDRIRQRLAAVWERIRACRDQAMAEGRAVLPGSAIFLDDDSLAQSLADRPVVELASLPDPASPAGSRRQVVCRDHGLLAQEIRLQRHRGQLLGPLVERLAAWRDKAHTVVVGCRDGQHARSMREFLEHYRLQAKDLDRPGLPEDLDAPGLYLVGMAPRHGFDLEEEGVHYVSMPELFGERPQAGGKRVRRSRARGEALRIDEIQPGDVVVHRDHGLGRFKGLAKMELAGVEGDFFTIEYQGGDLLYVPVDRLFLVSRYQGLGDREARLDRLGSSRWQQTRKKVQEAVWEVAQQLLTIQAARQTRPGIRFSPPGPLYHAVEESFGFDETPGQRQAIEEVLADMMRDHPMDRLICGDVGYGKTEVAVRAAVKAMEDGYQVAMLVPTTVLAEQHFATFSQRFRGLPLELGCLSRFRTPAEQRRILARLADGRLDFVVGTHRLLSRDVRFHRLGLLIVDEEHRFGVSHKEKLKKLRAEVDVLTLTATPIPRTLQLSLLGIRDLSVISTPPGRRRAVKTYLAEHDPLVIREAVWRELQRGGQVFVVHNRIQSIERLAEGVARLVPMARIGVGHAKMGARELEEVMVRFINHDLDVLVCTTIIESGLDIPNAGTIIINRADRFGLADIYQLRGRVGRSDRQSYAYLLVPSLEHVSQEAKKRLRALMDCTELGSGYRLAMNDLQIRGGGNILGVSQSGHITAVGFDLYLELLQATVQDLKDRGEKREAGLTPMDVEVRLAGAFYLPQEYVPDAAQRYHLYRRFSLVRDEAQLADLQDELRDRYGPLPAPALALLEVVRLKIRLARLGIQALEQGPKSLVFHFGEHTPVAPETLVALAAKTPSGGRLLPDGRLVVAIEPGLELEKRLAIVRELLEQIS